MHRTVDEALIRNGLSPANAGALRPLRGMAKTDLFVVPAPDVNTAASVHVEFVRLVLDAVAAGELPARPGADDLLAACRDVGAAVCLMTGFDATVQRALLDVLAWNELVDLTVAQSDRLRGRPWPHTILSAKPEAASGLSGRWWSPATRPTTSWPEVGLVREPLSGWSAEPTCGPTWSRRLTRTSSRVSTGARPGSGAGRSLSRDRLVAASCSSGRVSRRCVRPVLPCPGPGRSARTLCRPREEVVVMEDEGPDPACRLRPDRRRALGVLLEGFRSGPREVPLLAVDLAPHDDADAVDVQVDLFRMGFAPVRSLDGEIYPALHSWSIRHGSDEAGHYRWVSLAYDGDLFAAFTLIATERWTELVDALGLVVLTVGDFGLAEVERLPDAMRQDAYADRVSVRTREGRALGATVRANTW